MSYSNALTPAPVQLPSMQAGETDSRYMDCTPDLGPVSDTFPNIGACSVVVTRADGNALTENDLSVSPSGYPAYLDSTGLIPTFWYQAPLLAAGVDYVLTLTVNKTTQQRIFKRTFLLDVVAQLG